MEDYKKKYEEALKRARKINSGEGVVAPSDYTICETIFPELKESENEKTRKEIIKYIEGTFPNEFSGIKSKNKWIARLEKQGKNEEINEASYRAGIKRVLDNPESYGLKKQGEQKPTWSEEDERKITGISMVLESWDSYHVCSAGLPSLIPEYISWLNSLKERIKGE